MSDPTKIDGKKVIGTKPPRYFMLPGEVLLEAKETLQEYMAKKMGEPREPYQPGAFFNRAGNSFECHWSTMPFYAQERGDLTLHLAMDSDEIVGVQVHGVIQKMGLIEQQPQTWSSLPTTEQERLGREVADKLADFLYFQNWELLHGDLKAGCIAVARAVWEASHVLS